MDKRRLIKECRLLLDAYKSGKLGDTTMPEDSNPRNFNTKENRASYFTLPMSLNYQRDSYKLWQSALKTYQDNDTKTVFDVSEASRMSNEKLRGKLTKYKLALQPNKHVQTWQTISKTIFENWGNVENLLEGCQFDFLKLRQMITKDFKKGFPYLSGPKIFNYWSFIIQEYGGVKLKKSQFIEIAPDTHIIKCSIKLGVISQEESEKLSRDQISERWRKTLDGSAINPIDMHPPLWFWSKNNFIFKLE
ncbi:MAG: hypothetical protein HW405_1009 [Candidatus Berkelbacteria bacterium]|nr:hypothetical protein [Candidatus Berkelbacteria bacterium]